MGYREFVDDVNLNANALKPEYKDLAISLIRFQHLTDEAQALVKASGRAIFWRSGMYQAINAPEEK